MNRAAIISARTDCQVIFGGEAAALNCDGGPPVLQVALPVLAGRPDESLLADAEMREVRAGFALFQRGTLLAGLATAPAGASLEDAAGELYARLFAVTAGRHLYRIWNYVPQINAVESGLENYRRFCRGRSLAFERHFGTGFKELLPAASAVGTTAGPLALGFLAGTALPRHFENPRQVPAFEYPPLYGPRPPSFARATAVTDEAGRHIIISGTAAIRGHETVATGELDAQLTCTLANLELIAATAGAGPGLGVHAGWTRRFKIYIRHATDLAAIRRRLESELLVAADGTHYLQADICRAGLLVEIEAILTAPA